jgi:hypothetical protein
MTSFYSSTWWWFVLVLLCIVVASPLCHCTDSIRPARNQPSSFLNPYYEVAQTFERDKQEGKFSLGEYVLYVNGTLVAHSFDIRVISPKMQGHLVYLTKVTKEIEYVQMF